MADHRLVHVEIDQPRGVRWNADIEQERKVAIFDLLEANSFEPLVPLENGHQGPYRLILGVRDNRLLFSLSDADGAALGEFTLPVGPFRRVVKDYFQICESYFEAIKSASPAKIEAIDMGRRGIHNEGSEQLIEALKDKAKFDFDTARRLFTLICVLHLRS